MNAIFSEKDPNVKVLIPWFQGDLSLYFNNETHQIGFLDREIYAMCPELRYPECTITTPQDPLSIEDARKRKIYLVLKHGKWISPYFSLKNVKNVM